MLLQKCSYKRVSSSRNSWKRLWQVQVSGNWLYHWTEWISIFRNLMENWWIHKSANKTSRWKKMYYMGLSELMRMILIFVTFCLNKKKMWGLLWWRSGWESACQCRGHGFEPWSGRISHAAEQLGPWVTTTEPAHLEPVLRNRRGRDSERPTHRDEEWPPLAATGESPLTERKTQQPNK